MQLRLVAPFSGWAAGLDQVCDKAFADRLLGEGLALDPLEGEVRSPCASVVVAVAPSRHSVTIRTEIGVDLLIHVGVDTVELHGEGFEALVAAGAEVQAGQPLLRFDLDRVARRARSLLTPIIVLTPGTEVRIVAQDRLVSAGEVICCLSRPDDASAAAPVVEPAGTVSRRVGIPLANGVHARPAARLCAALKPHRASVRIEAHGRTGDARSVTAWLSLDLRRDDEVLLTAQGEDAEAAIGALAQLIASGLHEGEPETVPPAANPPALEAESRDEILAIRAAPGGADGIAVRLQFQDREAPPAAEAPEREAAKLAEAIGHLALALRAEARTSPIAEAHLGLLEDPEINAAARRGLEDGVGAAMAWRLATRERIDLIRGTGNRLLSERAADLIDVERRLIDVLLGGAPHGGIDLPHGAIVLADELLPSAFQAMASDRLAGIVTARGGPTSHVAILAAGQGVPMLVGAGEAVLEIADGTRLLIDERRPALLVSPADDVFAEHAARRSAARAAAAAQARAARRPAMTRDGHRIEVFANCGSAVDAAAAAAAGAEGCGLLRTEFLFLGRSTAPDEDEQAQAYRAVAEALDGRPLIVRTLDAGSDKPLPFLPIPPEDNPALGLRGLRLSLQRPEMLAVQFRAILRGTPQAQRRIMLPMVNDVAELRRAAEILRACEADLRTPAPTPLGVMIETPAAALLAASLAREADFLSLGTNDLAQYALAVDRGHPQLAARSDPLHPAVLKLVASAVAGAKAAGRWIGVCGAIASDLEALPLLIGLGLDEVSGSPGAAPALKARVRELSLDACRRLAAEALEEADAAGVRRRLTAFLEEASA